MKLKQYNGISINADDPAYITEFSKTLLDDFYMRPGETISEALARPAIAYCRGDYELAQRIYDYADKGWMMYASPVLSNAPKGVWKEGKTEVSQEWDTHNFVLDGIMQGQPISCFAFFVPDTAKGQLDVVQELGTLSMAGGGTGAHLGIRAIGGKAVGPIPYEKMMDSAIAYFKQPKRRGALCAYLNVDHPDIIEHIRFRKPGGDSKRRSDNRQQFHTGVNLTEKFAEAVFNDTTYELVCPYSGEVRETLQARAVWEEIWETRALTGEPMLLKIDDANAALPQSQKDLGLRINGSNLCSEILLPTNDERTFVCCLSSLNIEKYEEWKDTNIVQDMITFLDNVLQSFIDSNPAGLEKAVFSAMKERALGLGTLGWHGYLQSKSIPFEGGGFNSSIQHTRIIYGAIGERAEEESRRLAVIRGEPDDMKGTGLRNSRTTAIAPNANSADLLDASPCIEPYYRNVFVKSSRAGNYIVKNRHLQRVLQSHGKDTEEEWKAINENGGRVDKLDYLSDHDKAVFAVAMQLDMHWVIEQAEHRGEALGPQHQAQSLNLFFPFGSTRKYVNSVGLKWLKARNVYTLYYYRGEKEGDVDNAKAVERKALVDWTISECVSCSG